MTKFDAAVATDAILRAHFVDGEEEPPNGLEDAIYNAIADAVSAALDDVDDAVAAVRREY